MKKLLLCLFFLLLPINVWAVESNTTPSDELEGKQRDYYLRVFNYTMDNSKDNKAYHWETGAAKGDIRVSKEYISKSKSLCRNFTETFKIDGQVGKSEGAACKRDGNNGWCRLKHEDAHTCALEEPQGVADKLMNDAEGALGKGNEMIRNTKDWWNR